MMTPDGISPSPRLRGESDSTVITDTTLCSGEPESVGGINDQWRICFRFEAGNAFHVEIVDYH